MYNIYICIMYILRSLLEETSYMHNVYIELTKITTMLLKATRYIIFLVFFQVLSIIYIYIIYVYINTSKRPGSRRRDWDFFVIPSRAGITNFTGIIDQDLLIGQNVILGILLIFIAN